ncbi:MAG: UPF0149 family protein [Pseudomonadales bacterium]
MSDLYALALNAIRDQAQSLSTSELHGAVVGIGVCSEQSFSLQSLVDLLGVDALSDENDVEAFVNASLEILFADDMSFTPLLPEDDAPLEIRVTAIGEWTGSFVAGLVAGLGEQAAGSFAALPEEVQEIVADFTAITEIDLPGDSAAATGEEVAAEEDALAAGEEAEFDLLQVQEFVKIGALLVMSLLNDVPGDTTE